MKKKFDQVYQFKVTLKGIRPPIWRRIQVPETYTFWDLHVAIQDAMGWEDYHLNNFEIPDPSIDMIVEIGIPSDEAAFYDNEVLPETRRKISKYFSIENKSAIYTYDFGDNWEHNILLEKILPREKNVSYPRCIKGKRACPPEDCGGVWGYEELLEVISNPGHEEYEEMMEWLGEEFDPEVFDPEEVIFSDPDRRRRIAFG
jgi:hypothetical protein